MVSNGAAHELFPFVNSLKNKIDAVKSALDNYNNAIREEKMAEAEVAIAKEALVRQYEVNNLDARRKYGRSTCEKLFPRTNTRNTSVEPDEYENEPELQA